MKNIKNIEDYCEALSNALGPCKKCQELYHVIAVFKDNTSNEIIGYKLICNCNYQDEWDQEYLKNLKMYSNNEIIQIIRNNK